MINKLAELEALLFCHGEPVSFKKIASVLEVKESEAEGLVREFQDKLGDGEGGLTLLVRDGQAQYVTRPECGHIAQKLVQDEFKEELSPAVLETLSVIAYLGPLRRSEIDYVRGVNSSFVLRNLILRGLVERRERRAKGYEYSASFEFLKHIGLKDERELPEYAKYKDLMKQLLTAETQKDGET